MGTEQIIAVSAGIISCETGGSHGGGSLQQGLRDPQLFPLMLHSRSALYNLSQVNTEVTGVILTIA